MKHSTLLLPVVALIMLTMGLSSPVAAQLRANLPNPSELTGPVVQDPSQGAKLSNLFNMQMDHSYSMMFSSFGGQMHNMNAYTNTMQFFFTENLTGRVDLSLLHSPFGNSFMQQDSGLNTEFIIRNAELSYEISDNSHVRVQFQQRPTSYGPWGYGRNAFSPYRNPFFD
ncbi:MAG TPA: hypothetical protein VK112_09315 [Fodinibius sp.]|nr:hypothetical protein [Fodinibius sp.]